MGIQSTKYTSRDAAINRIIGVSEMVRHSNYRELELVSFETEENILAVACVDLVNISQWTDSMLSDQMDLPLYRASMFENYLIMDD